MDVEKNFDKFLEQDLYDNVEELLFQIIRKAYMAGYKAGFNEYMTKIIENQ